MNAWTNMKKSHPRLNKDIQREIDQWHDTFKNIKRPQEPDYQRIPKKNSKQTKRELNSALDLITAKLLAKNKTPDSKTDSFEAIPFGRSFTEADHLKNKTIQNSQRTVSLSQINRHPQQKINIDNWLNNTQNRFARNSLQRQVNSFNTAAPNAPIREAPLNGLIRVTQKRLESRCGNRDRFEGSIFGDSKNFCGTWAQNSGFVGNSNVYPIIREKRKQEQFPMSRDSSFVDRYRPGSSFESLRSGLNQHHVNYTNLAFRKLPPIRSLPTVLNTELVSTSAAGRRSQRLSSSAKKQSVIGNSNTQQRPKTTTKKYTKYSHLQGIEGVGIK